MGFGRFCVGFLDTKSDEFFYINDHFKPLTSYAEIVQQDLAFTFMVNDNSGIIDILHECAEIDVQRGARKTPLRTPCPT